MDVVDDSDNDPEYELKDDDQALEVEDEKFEYQSEASDNENDASSEKNKSPKMNDLSDSSPRDDNLLLDEESPGVQSPVKNEVSLANADSVQYYYFCLDCEKEHSGG